MKRRHTLAAEGDTGMGERRLVYAGTAERMKLTMESSEEPG